METSTLYRALTHPQLLGPLLQGESWRPWLAFAAALFGVQPDDERAHGLILRATGRTTLPTAAAREAWVVVGRRGGKSYFTAILAALCAVLKPHTLAPGEVGGVPFLALLG